MRLSLKQCDFARMVGKLLGKAEELKIQAKMVELWRSPEKQWRLFQEKKTWTLDSKHIKGLAVDLAIIKEDGAVYSEDGSDYRPLGEYWESIGGRWGGKWKTVDVYHFEYRG